jgi:predicted RecA/RadA family phage recombinase
MLLTQRRIADVQSIRTINSGNLVMIGGVDVVMQTESRTGTVGVLTWEEAGVLYEFSADEAPEGLPTVKEARQLVEALVGR